MSAIPILLILSGPASMWAAHPDDDPSQSQSEAPHIEDARRIMTSRSSEVDLPLPDEEDAFFFVVFGDRTGGPAEGIEVLAEAVQDVNLLQPDLVMTVGDLVEGYNAHPQWMTQMREYRATMNNLSMPWFPVAGNHDIYWRGDGTPPPGEHEGDYEAHFGPLWYAFQHKNAWFIALFSDEGNPATGEKNFNKPECQRMSDEQFEWLKATLEQAKDADHVFLFLHHPRWLGGQYGDDWNRVHEALVQAGAETTVFGGHIHKMRYDGVRDGIEYITLATTGGAQSGLAPEAGYLHQYHVVTVRQNRLGLTALPVGEAIDVRSITGEVSDATAILAQLQPQITPRVHLAFNGAADSTFTVTITNPVARPIEVTLAPRSDDSRWYFAPDHHHQIIQPGKRAEFEFNGQRIASPFDHSFRAAQVALDIDYLSESARFSIPQRTIELPVRLDLPLAPPPEDEMALRLDGQDDCLSVPSDLLEIPDGPLTLECWFKGEHFAGRRGLVTKTENSEFGFFVNDATPAFYIFLGDSYVSVQADEPILEPGRWYHIAGVYDGAETRLYLNGKRIKSVERHGPRRTNGFPLYIGADPDPRGAPSSYFIGLIDGVRLSVGARYNGETFTPQRRLQRDDATRLLFNMDAFVGAWTPDESGKQAHASIIGDPQIDEVQSP